MRYKTLCVDFESGSSSVMYEGDSQIQAILAAEDLNEQSDAAYAEELSNDDPSLTDEDIEDIIRDEGSFALVGLVFDMEDAKVVYWESKDTSDFCEPVPAGPLAAQLFGVDEDVAESAN